MTLHWYPKGKWASKCAACRKSIPPPPAGPTTGPRTSSTTLRARLSPTPRKAGRSPPVGIMDSGNPK